MANPQQLLYSKEGQPGYDPALEAIRAQFAGGGGPGGADGNTFAPGATGAPQDIIPHNALPIEVLQRLAQRMVLSKNANAKPAAVTSQVQALQQNPEAMQAAIAEHGDAVGIPSAAPAQPAQSPYISLQDDRNATAPTPEQPQTIQQYSSALPPDANEEAAEGLSDSPQEEATEAPDGSSKGNTAPGVKPAAQSVQAEGDAMFDQLVNAGLSAAAATAAVGAAYVGWQAAKPMLDRSPAAALGRQMNANVNAAPPVGPAQTSMRKAPIEPASVAPYAGGTPPKSALPDEAMINDMISEGGPVTSTPARPTEKTVSGAGKSRTTARPEKGNPLKGVLKANKSVVKRK